LIATVIATERLACRRYEVEEYAILWFDQLQTTVTHSLERFFAPVRNGAFGFFNKLGGKLRLRQPPLIDRGLGLIYDVERNITWLKDANYARTTGRTPDGQLMWDDAMSWIASLEYCGIAGWRLPTALDPGDGTPYVGEYCIRGELGHLFCVTSGMPAGSIRVENSPSFSIYWTSTEASATEAYAFKLVGLEQGPLEKRITIPVGYPVLAWPVHDGDVYAQVAPG
jgi:hypothetical protein